MNKKTKLKTFSKMRHFYKILIDIKIYKYLCSLAPSVISPVPVHLDNLARPSLSDLISRLVMNHVYFLNILTQSDHVFLKIYFWIVMYSYKVEYLNPKNVLLDRFIFCFHNEDTLRFTYHPLKGPFIPILQFYDVNS